MYQDDLHKTLEAQLSADPNFQILYHKNCVSKYTLLPRHLRKRSKSVEKEYEPSPKLRCLQPPFNFLTKCLYCGNDCDVEKDPKNPGRWHPSYICRSTVSEYDHKPYKEYLLGILSDDTVLAAALWRNLFNRQCEDPRQVELMVEYVRKQMQFLDALDGDDLLLTGEVKWRPLVEENAQSILKIPNPTYNDAGL